MNSPTDENEMVKLFIDAQDSPYDQAILGSIGKTVAQIMEQVEAIEWEKKKEKVVDMTAMKLQVESLQNNKNGWQETKVQHPNPNSKSTRHVLPITHSTPIQHIHNLFIPHIFNPF